MNKLITPFTRFINSASFAGMLLFICAMTAFVWSNSRWAKTYFAIKDFHIGTTWMLDKSIEFWVNDFLMAFFFLLVGLEIKREIKIGELSNPRQASLAIIAALGGMVAPACAFNILNAGGAGARGWGIPMATDIAFALGVLSLLGSRVPLGLKVFLTALAIVDDLGAVIIIAFFYTTQLHIVMLMAAIACWGLALLAGVFKVHNLIVYGILGILLWYFLLQSGLHPTIAGVLVALCVPLAPKINTVEEISGRDASNEINLKNNSALHRLEHALYPVVTYFVLPIFALSNAGVTLSGNNNSFSSVSLGVLAGLLLGKPVGILLCCFTAVKMRIAVLPSYVNWHMMTGVSILAGIGFTMALFITNLAFTNDHLLNQAKIGVLSASVIAAIIGFVWLRWALHSFPEA